MNYYWSCWYNKEELRALGANGVLPAYFNGFRLVPINHVYHWQTDSTGDHSVFRGDETLSLFLKLKADKPIIEIPERFYAAIQRGDTAKIGRKSKLGNAMNLCRFDF